MGAEAALPGPYWPQESDVYANTLALSTASDHEEPELGLAAGDWQRGIPRHEGALPTCLLPRCLITDTQTRPTKLTLTGATVILATQQGKESLLFQL